MSHKEVIPRSHQRRIVAGVVLWILFLGCASEAPPPGGPKDVDPPEVIQTIPPPGAVNVSPSTGIQVEFDEYLTRGSVEPAIFISPYTEDGYRVSTGRRTVTIEFSGRLGDSTTYIVTFGTGISDLRGNTLASSYQLAFSTGPSIDQGTMAGRVYAGEEFSGDKITLLAYRLDSVVVDSVIQRRPDYIANPDARGNFRLTNLETGPYFFMALIDQNRNFLYDPGEAIGLPWKKRWMVRDTVQEVTPHMRMFRYPADSLIMVAVEQQNRHLLRVEFNRSPVQEVTRDHFRFIEDDGDSIRPAAVSGTDNAKEYLVEHYQTVPDSQYIFVAGDLTDRFGLPFGENRDRRDLTISGRPDTLPFAAPGITPQDSMTDVRLEEQLRISFDRAVRPIRADKALSLDSAAADTVHRYWADPRTLVTAPDSLWLRDRWIAWQLADSLVKDYRDSTFSDSISSGTFRTETGGDYGSITGSVRAPASWAPELVRVRAESEALQKGTYRETRADSGFTFAFPRLLPGQYRLEAYYDEDRSKTYTHGRPLPFVPAEKFVIFQDSIEVRSRWEQSGVTLQFPGITE